MTVANYIYIKWLSVSMKLLVSVSTLFLAVDGGRKKGSKNTSPPVHINR